MSISRGPEKPRWQKPELIVLVRSKPEEAVLTACKNGVKGPAHKDGCRNKNNVGCSTISTS